jgi:hypothetical protein
MPRTIDLAGMRFGRLYVLYQAETRHESLHWMCVCDCGKTSVVCSGKLPRGTTQSCGCFHRESIAERSTVHSESLTPEYTSWASMIRRCRTTSSLKYPNYAGRGITVCDRWLHGEAGLSAYQCFLADMGRKPTPKHTIERCENDGHYGNCSPRLGDGPAV